MKTLRLVFPQWQGADIVHWIPEIKNPADSARGYALGAQLLSFLAPENKSQKTCAVPVSMEIAADGSRESKDGVLDRDTLAIQAKEALSILDEENPDRVITLGGECSVSVPPFTWMEKKFGKTAVIWLDAHPDITLPGDIYCGYHAMALAACAGKGDGKILKELPAFIEPSRILIVGLRDWERDEVKARQKEMGISHLSVGETRGSSEAVIKWLESIGAEHVSIHFDMDVLDPDEIIPAVGAVKNGLKMAEAVRIINDVCAAKEVNALTIAEPMPRTAIRLRNMLNDISVFKS